MGTAYEDRVDTEMPDLETLATTGFLFTETGVEIAVLTADFGDGYEAGALIGSPEGLRTWSVKIDVLPDNFEYIGEGLLLLEDGTFLLAENGETISLPYDAGIETGETRAEYLWQLFLRSKGAGNQPFWFEDPKDERRYLVCFVDMRLNYQVLCAKVYSTGIQLRQRRLRNISSPV